MSSFDFGVSQFTELESSISFFRCPSSNLGTGRTETSVSGSGVDMVYFTYLSRVGPQSSFTGNTGMNR